MLELSETLKEISEEYGYTPVDSSGIYIGVSNECRRDPRARLYPDESHASTLDGIAFDEKKIRTQAFTLINEMPVAVMTLAIVPERLSKLQRYFRYIPENQEVQVIDFKQMMDIDQTPKFLIVPAWTYIKKDLRNTEALPGFRMINQMINKIIEEAPENTWIECVAQGFRYPNPQKISLYVGGNYSCNSLGINPENLAKNTPGSSATVKFAKYLGLEQVNGIASASSLGPVFLKRVK